MKGKGLMARKWISIESNSIKLNEKLIWFYVWKSGEEFFYWIIVFGPKSHWKVIELNERLVIRSLDRQKNCSVSHLYSLKSAGTHYNIVKSSD